jgi:hypothetical protein
MNEINPLWFVGKLIVGLLCILCSVLLWVQLLLSQLVYPEENNLGSVFLDSFFQMMENNNANFVSIAFLMIIAVFLTCCIIKGSVFVSNSIPCITIHPIK